MALLFERSWLVGWHWLLAPPAASDLPGWSSPAACFAGGCRSACHGHAAHPFSSVVSLQKYRYLLFPRSKPGRNLFFAKAAKGDFLGTLERIGRCVEVFERFPGLCRFQMG